VTTKQSKHYRGIFRQVMTKFDETRSVLGTNSCARFYKGLAQEGGRVETNPRVIRMLPEDFIADVELAAKRALNVHEYFYFKTVYLNKDDKFDKEFKDTVSEKAYSTMKRTIQEKLGEELQRSKIYPIETYMQSVDLR
jgi:hypothetical protein